MLFGNAQLGKVCRNAVDQIACGMQNHTELIAVMFGRDDDALGIGVLRVNLAQCRRNAQKWFGQCRIEERNQDQSQKQIS